MTSYPQPLSMKKNVFLTLFILTVLSACSFAQSIDTTKLNRRHLDKELCLLTAFNAGKFGFAELGMSMNRTGGVGFHPYADAWFVSSEINPGRKTIIGPKIGAWVAGGAAAMVLGVNFIYYTDFTNSTLVFRPEIGFGLGTGKLVYGYNARLTNTSFDLINKNLVSLTYCIGVKRYRKGK